MAADVGAVTVKVTAGDAMAPLLATTEADPGLAAVARPGELLELPIVTTLVFEEFQVTVLVSVLAELSLYMPVAVNRAVAPVCKAVVLVAIEMASREGVVDETEPDDGPELVDEAPGLTGVC
jgi:hypothetical protein